MKLNLYLLLFFIITQNLLSQNIKIVGKIIDTNGKNIIGAHIVDKNSKYGVISNKYGFFELNANSFKDTLEISHIAYNTLTYIIQFDKYNSYDSIIFIDITLSTRINILNQVEINFNKENLVFKDKNIWIYDYELLDIDKILLIMDDTSKGEFHLINQHYKTLDKIKFNNKFLKIKNDCFNNIYLETNDSLYQIYIQDTIIYFYSAISKENFNKNLKNCEVVTNSYICL